MWNSQIADSAKIQHYFVDGQNILPVLYKLLFQHMFLARWVKVFDLREMQAENNDSRSICSPFSPSLLVRLDHVHLEFNANVHDPCQTCTICAYLALLEHCWRTFAKLSAKLHLKCSMFSVHKGTSIYFPCTVCMYVCPWTPPRVLTNESPNLAWIFSGSLR